MTSKAYLQAIRSCSSLTFSPSRQNYDEPDAVRKAQSVSPAVLVIGITMEGGLKFKPKWQLLVSAD